MQEVDATEDAVEIELLDLGDATIETKQWSPWPVYYDSAIGRGQRDT